MKISARGATPSRFTCPEEAREATREHIVRFDPFATTVQH
jgi:hypothetical protein